MVENPIQIYKYNRFFILIIFSKTLEFTIITRERIVLERTIDKNKLLSLLLIIDNKSTIIKKIKKSLFS